MQGVRRDDADKIKKVTKIDVEEQLAQLQRKFNLQCQSGEAYRNRAETERKLNEEIILFQRQRNKRLYIATVQAKYEDQRTIKTVLKDSKRNRLAIQSATCGASDHTQLEANIFMHKVASDACKILGGLRYLREKRTREVIESEKQLEWMKWMGGRYMPNITPEMLIRTENDIDKAEIKYRTAKSINWTYKNIIPKLEQEILHMPMRIDALQEAVLAQYRETNEMRIISESALHSRDQVKAELVVVEENAMNVKIKNDTELTKKKKDFDRRKQEDEKAVDKKHEDKDLSLARKYWEKALANMSEKKKRVEQQRVMEYEEALETVRSATHVTDVQETIKLLETQDNTARHLHVQAADVVEKRERLKERARGLQDEFDRLKYTGQARLSAERKRVKEIKQKIKEERDILEANLEELMTKGALFALIKEALESWVVKLEVFKLDTPVHSQEDRNVLDNMEICREKLKLLHEEFGTGKVAPKQVIPEKQLSKFIDGQLCTGNIRVALQPSLTGLLDHGYEGEDNKQVKSREEMKEEAQRLVDGKQLYRRKKGRK